MYAGRVGGGVGVGETYAGELRAFVTASTTATMLATMTTPRQPNRTRRFFSSPAGSNPRTDLELVDGRLLPVRAALARAWNGDSTSLSPTIYDACGAWQCGQMVESSGI
jgi:hypothetical protein